MKKHTILKIASAFKNPLVLDVYFLLKRRQSLYGYQIQDALCMGQSTVSYILKILKDAHIVKSTKIGRGVLFEIDPSFTKTILESLQESLFANSE